jgi:hypothetical protein
MTNLLLQAPLPHLTSNIQCRRYFHIPLTSPTIFFGLLGGQETGLGKGMGTTTCRHRIGQ